MTGWQIAPEQVQAVLTNVGAAAGTLSGAVDGLQSKVESAVAGTASSGIIADAIGGFFENRSVTLQSMGNRINAGVSGAVAATTAYLAGDEEMAAQQQAAATTAANATGTGASRPPSQAPRAQ